MPPWLQLQWERGMTKATEGSTIQGTGSWDLLPLAVGDACISGPGILSSELNTSEPPLADPRKKGKQAV